MRVAEMFVAGLGALAGLQHATHGHATRQRASNPVRSHRLVDLPIADICNQGGHWMAPIDPDLHLSDAPAGFAEAEPRFESCLHRIASRRLPEARSAALCLMEVAADTCAGGEDPWCIDALQRSSTDVIPRAGAQLEASLEPGPLPLATYRSLDQLRRDIHAEFRGRTVYQDAMQRMEIEIGDLTGLDLQAQRAPLTVGNVLQLLRDSDSGSGRGERVGASSMERFDWAARATGLQLGDLLESIGWEVINARPEHYRESLAEELSQWVQRNFASDAAEPITAHQRRHMVGLMLEGINARIAAGTTGDLDTAG